MRPPQRLRVAYAAAGLFVSLAAPSWGQDVDTLFFEQVGDQPIGAKDIAFDIEDTLWGSSSGHDLWRLSTNNEWEQIGDFFGDFLLVLSPDTLFLGHTAGTHRSTDGGETFNSVYDEGGALFVADLTGPNHGVILCGEGLAADAGIAYSTDRGATFTESTFTVSTSWTSTLHTAVEIPDGPAAGRLVAGVFNGIVISEDSGQIWAPSSLFQNGRYSTQRVVIGEAPLTGDRRLYATVTDAQASGPQFYTSDDDGLMWTNVPGFVDAYLFVVVPGTPGSLLAVERGYDVQTLRIELWRSLDGGQTWQSAGNLPADPDGDGIHSDDMLIGPDNHLYVAVGRTGPDGEWVYRTMEPVFVANEPGVPELPETVFDLSVRPNPARGKAIVPFSVESAARIQLMVFDMLGREVATLADGRYDAGVYEAVFNGSDLPSGMYLLHANVTSESGGATRTFTQRLTLLK